MDHQILASLRVLPCGIKGESGDPNHRFLAKFEWKSGDGFESVEIVQHDEETDGEFAIRIQEKRSYIRNVLKVEFGRDIQPTEIIC
jgi:hypothetical protein